MKTKLLAFTCLLALSTLHANGAVLTVTSLADSGPGSLRAEVALCNPGDSIQFSVTGVILLSSPITIGVNALWIIGPGPNTLVVDPNHTGRAFVTTASSVMIAGMTIRNGLFIAAPGADGAFGQNGQNANDGWGGAILVNGGDLTLSNCWVTLNTVVGGQGGRGGDNPIGAAYTPGNGGNGGNGSGAGVGVFAGQLTIVRCTFSGNRAIGGNGGAGGNNLNAAVAVSGGIGGGGGTGGGGAIYGDFLGTSTFSGNYALGGTGGHGGNSVAASAGGLGGGGGDGQCGAMVVSVLGTVYSCTIAYNSAIGGQGAPGGTGTPNGSPGGTGSGLCGGVCGYNGGMCLTEFGNDIIAENYATTMYSNTWLLIKDMGWNYFGDNVFVGPCVPAFNTRVGTLASPLHPQLEPLQQNGGGFPTHMPVVGSPVIDWGRTIVGNFDQRLAPRPFGSPAPGSNGDGSDIGAIEFGAPVMGMAKIGNNMVISWPAYYGNFVLQSASSLSGSGNWSDVTNTPMVVGNQFTVTNYPTSSAQFFRLINR